MSTYAQETKDLLSSANLNVYQYRMDHVDDKKLLLNLIPSDARVLDFGCGTGLYAEYLKSDRYVGYDLSEEMVSFCKKKYPSYSFVSSLDGQEKFDAILLSSVLHEVYSYSKFSMDAVKSFLVDLKELLNPNGKILIREGLKLDDFSYEELELKNPLEAEYFLSEIKKVRPLNASIRGNLLCGELTSLAEFLNVYTWGLDSLDREKKEIVNFATKAKWRNLLWTAGYSVDGFLPILQEDYFVHLEDLVNLNGRKWENKVVISAKI